MSINFHNYNISKIALRHLRTSIRNYITRNSPAFSCKLINNLENSLQFCRPLPRAIFARLTRCCAATGPQICGYRVVPLQDSISRKLYLPYRPEIRLRIDLKVTDDLAIGAITLGLILHQINRKTPPMVLTSKLSTAYPQYFIAEVCSGSGRLHYPRSFRLVTSKRNVMARFELWKRGSVDGKGRRYVPPRNEVKLMVRHQSPLNADRISYLSR